MTEEIKVTLRGEPGAEPNDSLGIKGSALTYSELDSNFEKLRDGINQLLVTVDYISLDNNTNKITEGSDNSVEETEPGLGDGTNNLFYTDEKVQTYLTDNDYTNQEWVLTQLTALSGAVTELTTSDGITEGTENLYYTDARARSAISVDGNLTYDSATGVISYTAPTIEWTVVENTPTTVSNYGITDVYTKSETDAAITNRVTEIASGDISLTGYATEAYADQAEVDAKAYTDTRETAITSAYTSAISTAVAGKDNTDEITEGSTNLYFTDARADARVANATGVNLSIASRDTDDLSEGTSNLYFTDARAVAAVKSALSMTHSGVYVVTAADETNNTGSSRAISASDLGFNVAGTEIYQVYLNRQLLRPTEYTVNTSNGTLTFDADLLAENDEIEAVIYS